MSRSALLGRRAHGRLIHRPGQDERGGVTVEAALAIGAFTVVLAAALGGVSAAATQLHCVDAAREAARLVALGDVAGAHHLAEQIAPGSALSIHLDGDEITTEVSAEPPSGLLPGLHLHGEAYAIAETGTAAAGTNPAPPTTDPQGTP